MGAPSRKQSIAIKLASMLQEMPVGSQLTREAALARELGCARNTLRQALEPYVKQGVLHRQAGAGTWLVRHPKVDTEPMLDIWIPAEESKSPPQMAAWDDLLMDGPDVRFTQQEHNSGAWLESEILTRGAMRASSLPSLEAAITPYLREQAASHALADLTDICKQLPEHNKIEKWAWSLCSWKKRIYGIPYRASCIGLWIETDALTQANLQDVQLRNWGELTEVLKILKQHTGRRLAVPAIRDGGLLLGTLTALAGGGVQHDEPDQTRPEQVTDTAVRRAMQWVWESVWRDRVLDPRITFGRTEWPALHKRCFGFFHGLQPLVNHPQAANILQRFTFCPLPALNKQVDARWSVAVMAIMLNQRLTPEVRQAALQYIHLSLQAKTLRKRCKSDAEVFLARRDQWHWPERPQWFERCSHGWKWIIKQPLAPVSSPAGMNLHQASELVCRCLRGERVHEDDVW